MINLDEVRGTKVYYVLLEVSRKLEELQQRIDKLEQGKTAPRPVGRPKVNK